MDSLNVRITAFLNQAHPTGMCFVHNSLAEQLIKAYQAGTLKLDAETAQFLRIGETECRKAAIRADTLEKAIYFQECGAILRAIREAVGKW